MANKCFHPLKQSSLTWLQSPTLIKETRFLVYMFKKSGYCRRTKVSPNSTHSYFTEQHPVWKIKKTLKIIRNMVQNITWGCNSVLKWTPNKQNLECKCLRRWSCREHCTHWGNINITLKLIRPTQFTAAIFEANWFGGLFILILGAERIVSTLELNPNKTDGNLFSIPEHKGAQSQHSRCMTCTFKHNLCDPACVTGPFIYKNKNLWKTRSALFINKWRVWHILMSSKSSLPWVHEKQVGFFFSAPLNDFCYMKVFQVNRYGILTHNGAANVVRAAVAYKAAMSCLSIAKVKDT